MLPITSIQDLAVPDVYKALDAQPQGLNAATAGARLRHYGPNVLRKVGGTPLIYRFLANFTHLMAILLWAGGVIGFVAQMPQLGVAIWMVNVINGVFSFWQEYKAEKATEAMRRLLPAYARVLRDGQETRILAEELVPGDMMLLAEGDRISADGRLVQEAELSVDQSTLTGESHPVRKTSDAAPNSHLPRNELPNLVFAGTSVSAGVGKAVVYATGMQTEFGQIATLTQSLREELSPLQKEMVSVTRVVTAIALGIGFVFFVISAAFVGISLGESFIFAMGMIVAFVPEGLLPTVTLALAMGTQRMARRNALIKRLSAVETLGCTTVICTDKTGTLTQNEMTVRNLWVAGRRLAVTGVGYAPDGEIVAEGRATTARDGACDADLRELLTAGALCNNARLLPPNGDGHRWSVLGDPTEAALSVAAVKGRVDLAAEARRAPRVRELPFDSRRKRMSTIHWPAGGAMQAGDAAPLTARPSPLVYVKGAPKEVLALCTHLRLNGEDCPLDEAWRARIVAANDEYARAGLRVLAVAERALCDAPRDGLSRYTPESLERDLTFLGLQAMMDPPRHEVAEAVAKCHRAGMRVIMITGDYGLTAESIARRIGIIRGPQPRIVTGAELDALSDDDLGEAMQSEVIFARVSPEHKLRVVSALQALGHIVAVTGDGVNDAPALKKADIGVAMGITGTDVAKEAGDMILTDDNFASIVNAVEEGRAVYSNIKKFTTYHFTSNAPEAVPFILFAFSGGRIPLALSVMHVLSIDLGTDIMPALALGAEPPEPGVMDRPPRSLTEHVITAGLLSRAYVLLGPVEGLAEMAAFFFWYWTNGYAGQWLGLPGSGALYAAGTAMALAAVVATQIGNLFAQRTERESIFHLGLRHLLFSNRLIWVGIASELTLVLLIVYVPLFQAFVGTAAFPWANWLFLFAWTPSLVVVDELRKALVRRRAKSAVRV